ncbi:MAG: hypothetical protein Q7J06_09875, partial [Bacteroidales bacterium]|nr:hypothetical protein [Bacteroidales bacterium]
IKDNSKALQFQIGSNFQLQSFQGSSISLKKHKSIKRAIRYGLTIGGGAYNDQSNTQIIENDSLDEKTLNDQTYFSATIYSQYLIYHPSEHSYMYYVLRSITWVTLFLTVVLCTTWVTLPHGGVAIFNAQILHNIGYIVHCLLLFT